MTYDAPIRINSPGKCSVRHIEAVKRITLVCMLLLFASTSAFAQDGHHRCEVYVSDFNNDTRTNLGEFTTVVQADKPMTKSFQFPGRKLVVTASVNYAQSTDAPGGQADQIVLVVVLGKKAYPEGGEGLTSSEVKANARAVVPLKSFERAIVETIFLENRQPIIIGLGCK